MLCICVQTIQKCISFNRDKWCADCLMIDGLVSQCGERLNELWKRDEGGTGHYPPPSLHVSYDFSEKCLHNSAALNCI